jgi:hypothetical protein
MTRPRLDAHAKALLAQRPPADAVSYTPAPGRLSLIIQLEPDMEGAAVKRGS